MMSFENFEKATSKGYDKFTTMAKNYYDLKHINLLYNWIFQVFRFLEKDKETYPTLHWEQPWLGGWGLPRYHY